MQTYRQSTEEMVHCSHCAIWHHLECVLLHRSESIGVWPCPRCRCQTDILQQCQRALQDVSSQVVALQLLQDEVHKGLAKRMHVKTLEQSNLDLVKRIGFKIGECDDLKAKNAELELQLSNLDKTNCNKREIPRVVYNFKQADFSALRSLITNSNRPLNTSLNHSTHMNEAWSIWSSTVTEHINQCIPRVPVKNSSKHPRMDGEVRHMHNCNHTAWAAAKRTNNVQMWNKFKCLRNKLKLMLRDKRSNLNVCETN